MADTLNVSFGSSKLFDGNGKEDLLLTLNQPGAGTEIQLLAQPFWTFEGSNVGAIKIVAEDGTDVLAPLGCTIVVGLASDFNNKQITVSLVERFTGVETALGTKLLNLQF